MPGFKPFFFFLLLLDQDGEEVPSAGKKTNTKNVTAFSNPPASICAPESCSNSHAQTLNGWNLWQSEVCQLIVLSFQKVSISCQCGRFSHDPVMDHTEFTLQGSLSKIYNWLNKAASVCCLERHVWNVGFAGGNLVGLFPLDSCSMQNLGGSAGSLMCTESVEFSDFGRGIEVASFEGK